MKLTYLIARILLFTSCSSPETSDDRLNETFVDSSASINEQVTSTPEEPIKRNFEISEMSKKWWILSEEDGGFIVIDRWDAQEEYIEFSSDDEDNWYLEILYPQETFSGQVTNFKATIKEGDGIQIAEGSFTYTCYYTEKPETVTFIWDQPRYYIQFDNLIPGETTYYVADESKDFFPFQETFREPD